MDELKKYVVTKEGYFQIVVSLTEREVTILRNFIEWGAIDEDFFVESMEDCDTADWGI